MLSFQRYLQSIINSGVFDVKRVKEETKEEMPRKQLSDSDSSAGETKQKNTRRQKVILQLSTVMIKFWVRKVKYVEVDLIPKLTSGRILP